MPSHTATAATLAPDATGIPYLAIAMLSLTAMGSGIAMRVSDALLPRLASDFGITLGQAAQVITTFSVAYGLSQLVFGPLGDRHGKYRVIGWAALASAGTSLLCALASGHASLLAARLLAGASAGAVIPLAMAWIGDVVPYAKRQAVLARFLMGQMTGVALGAWLGGITAEHWPWRAPFFGIAALFALAALVLQVVRRRLPAAALAVSARTASAPGARASLAGIAAEFAAVLALPRARRVLACVAAEGAVFFGAFAFVAAHLHQRLGLPLSTVGALVMLFAAGGLGYAVCARWLLQRLGEQRMVRTGAAGVLAAMLSLAAVPNAAVAMLACALLGLGFYMVHNTLQTHATQMAPERRGTAVSTFAACFFLGQSAGVGLAGLLVGQIGTAALLVIGGIGLAALGWAFAAGLAPPHSKVKPT